MQKHGQRMTSSLINVLEFGGQGLSPATRKTQWPQWAGSEPLRAVSPHWLGHGMDPRSAGVAVEEALRVL